MAPSEEAAPQQPGPSDAPSGPSALSGQLGSGGGTSSGAGPQPDSQRKRAREEDSKSDSGVISAKPNNVLNKYITGFSLPCERIFGSVSDLPKDLIAPAFSNSSWRAMESAWNNFKAFEKFSDQAISFPLDQKTVNNLIIWLFKSKKLRHSSIVAYLNSLSSILTLKSLDCKILKSYATKIALKGCKNLEFQSEFDTRKRKVMTLSLLKLIGHGIAISNWDSDSKRVFWSACCIMFFGGFRVGEILASRPDCFDPLSCLTWDDIKFLENSILIQVKQPKSRAAKNEFVDIFSFPEKNCCPVKAICGLKKHSLSSKMASNPVFRFKNGILLTPSAFNNTMRNILSASLGPLALDYSSHSFRAAIPSALAKSPDVGTRELIKLWGRWESEAFKSYTRLKKEQRQNLHKKICNVLLFRPT